MNILILIFFTLPFLNAKNFTPIEMAKLAEKRAPLIKYYVEEERKEKAQYKQTRLFGNPVLTYQGGRMRSGTQSGQVTDLTLMQPIPWPGKRSLAIKSQEFLNRIAELDVEETQLLVGHRVYILAHNLASQIEIEKHNKERRDRFTLIAKYLSSRPLVSPKQILEKDIIESQIRLVEKLMKEMTARKNSMTKELVLLTGEIEPEVSVNWDKLPNGHEKDFYQVNLDEGPLVKKKHQTVRLSENRIEEARLMARPDIMVGMNYRLEDTSPRNHFYHGQVAVVIPIVDRGQHTVEMARAQLRREEASMKLAIQESNTELIYAYENLMAAKDGMKLFPLSLRKQSEERFRSAETAFRKGQIDVMTFLQSDTQIHENIGLIYKSRLEYLVSWSNLEQLIGHSMEEK